MNGIIRHLARAAILTVAVCGVTTVRANDGGSNGQRNAYVVTNLAALAPRDTAGCAALPHAVPA
jgi:pantothenate synthetase